jgi:hypothetical protein
MGEAKSPLSDPEYGGLGARLRCYAAPMNAAAKLEPREDVDPVMRALARAPKGRPVPPEVQAQIEASKRSIAAGERCATTAEVLDMIAQNAREQGFSEDEIQARVHGTTAAP